MNYYFSKMLHFNTELKNNNTSSGLPSQDIFQFNMLNLLNSSENVIRGFYCSLLR